MSSSIAQALGQLFAGVNVTTKVVTCCDSNAERAKCQAVSDANLINMLVKVGTVKLCRSCDLLESV